MLANQQNRTFGKVGKPKTGTYKPLPHWWFQQPRDLPPFSFNIIRFMLMDPDVRLNLGTRCAPLHTVEFAYKELGSDDWTPGIKADDPIVAMWVERQLKTIWQNYLPDILRAQVWGWSAGEVTWKLNADNLLEINELLPRHAQDCRQLDMDDQPYGVRVSRVEGKGHVDLRYPYCWWHNYGAEDGDRHGCSVLLGAYSPWADKWLNGGALDVRRLFMHKDAYGGVDIGYPEGETYVHGQANPVPNSDIARQIVEQLQSGGVTTRPSERDENGNEKWPLLRATIPNNPQHILQYPKDLDIEMRHGMGICDDVVSADGGGAWAGKRVTIAAFYASMDTWVVQIFRDLRRTLDAAAKLNWGHVPYYELSHKPLAEQAMEQQSNAGPGGAQAQGFDPTMGGMVDPSQGLIDDGSGMMDDGSSMIDPSQFDPNKPQYMGLDPIEAVGTGAISAATLVDAGRRALQDSSIVMMAAHRAPSGYTHTSPLVINGRSYVGGQFIPGDQMEHASEEQKAEILSGKKAGATEDGNKEEAKEHEASKHLENLPEPPSKFVSLLTSNMRLKLKNGHAATIAYDARPKSQGYFIRHTGPDSVRTTFPTRFKTPAEAARAGASLLQAKSKAVATPPKASEPGKESSPSTTPSQATESSDTPSATPKEREKAKTDEGNFRYKSRDFFASGLKAKYRDNVEAIRTLKTLEIEDREATPDEQEKLSKYVGWGQFPALFSYSWNSEWKKEQEELRSLIGDDEYQAARASTINAHYTHPDVIAAHWDMAKRLGFQGGKYLEPAVGAGYYIGLMPKEVSEKTNTTAIEMDPTSGKIAKYLYPAANVQVSPFQHYQTPDNFYDLVATNVPFSGDIRISDPKYKTMKPTLHDYYFLRSVDTTKPGGLIMHLTSAGTMDKLDDRVRKHIEQNCELVSAIRFPGDAHKENAGTDVVTDMLILRKKHPAIPPTTDETPDEAKPDKPGFTGTTVDSLGRLYYWRDGVRVPAPQWSKIVEVPDPDGGDPIPVNEYFASNPEQILGKLDRSGTMYTGNMKNVSKTDDYETRLRSAIERLPQGIAWSEKQPAREKPQRERIEATGTYNEGQFVVQDGQLFQHFNGALEPKDVNRPTFERIAGQIAIRDAARKLIGAQQSGEGIEQARSDLNAAYDAYVAKHGALHTRENKNAIKSDPDSKFLLSLENYNASKKEASKADLFLKDTIRRDVKASSAGSVGEATGIVLHETGSMDIDRIAELTGKSREEVEDDLVDQGLAFVDPSKGWTHAAEYLSGNTRKKLKEAEAAAKSDPKFQANVEALRKAQPEDIDQEDIGVKLGTPWIPGRTIAEFSAEMLGASPDDFNIKYTPSTGEWHVELKNRSVSWRSSNVDVWGVKDDSGDVAVSYMDLLDSALSGKPITVRASSKNSDGVYPVLQEQTEAAREKMEDLRTQFKEWVWSDDERAAKLHRLYNDNYNNYVPMKFDGSHLTLPGMKEGFNLRDVQKNFVWRVITTGKGLAAHEVGVGKTASMVAAAMELRRLGLAKKPAIAVMKSNIEQITAEAQELYPGAKILSTADMFDADKRQQTLNRIATGDYDMVIMTHDHLNSMRMKPETAAKFIQEEIDELSDSILAAEAEDVATGKKKQNNRIVKRLENQKQKLEEQLRAAVNEDTKDEIFFEDSGIDQLFVDEAHNFKSLPCHTRRGEIKGIPSQRSQRATNMLMRTRWLLDQHNGRGVVFATGTPIANTMGELFNMQRYLQFNELKERNVHRFDSWADTYGDTTNRLEFKLNGDVSPTTRFAEFVNLPELRHLASEFMDVQRADDLRNADGSPVIKRPKRNDQVIVSKSNEAIETMMQEIQKRAEAMKGKRRGATKGEDNMLNVCNDAKLGSIDMRLIDPSAEDHPDSKANQAVRKIVDLYNANPGKVQAVFSDLGIHPNAWGFSVFKDMKSKLVAAGIPENEILDFSDEKMTDAKRDEAQEALKRGDARIAFGSTKRLGTGTNFQKHLLAIHHLDIPYVPAYIEQRDGRGYRHGNTNPEIKILKYVQQGSADNLFWQIVSNKAHFINQYMLGKGNRSMQDLDTETLSPDEMIAVATGDEGMLERVSLEDDVRKLRRAETRHKTERVNIQQKLEQSPNRRKDLESVAASHAKDAKHFESNPDFELQIGSERHSERPKAEAGLRQAIANASQQMTAANSWDRPESIQIATYRKLPVHMTQDGMLHIQGPSGQLYESGPTLASLEYAARSIAKKHESAKKRLSDFESDLDKMQKALDQPFRYAKDMVDKETRLTQLKNERANQKPKGGE